MAKWRSFIELRPDELEAAVAACPVVYWPLGLIEHHGWHLPVGFDGIKAERLCRRCAEATGGLLLPVMWWGGVGGHGDFKWTFYQNPKAAGEMVITTMRKLVQYGIRVVVLLCGHYPWEVILRSAGIEAFSREFPQVLVLWGSEVGIAGDAAGLAPGDHAAKRETEFGLHLLPELIDLTALTPGRDPAIGWPDGQDPTDRTHIPALVDLDVASPLFGQMGENAAAADAATGEHDSEVIVRHIAATIDTHLKTIRRTS